MVLPQGWSPNKEIPIGTPIVWSDVTEEMLADIECTGNIIGEKLAKVLHNETVEKGTG